MLVVLLSTSSNLVSRILVEWMRKAKHMPNLWEVQVTPCRLYKWLIMDFLECTILTTLLWWLLWHIALYKQYAYLNCPHFVLLTGWLHVFVQFSIRHLQLQSIQVRCKYQMKRDITCFPHNMKQTHTSRILPALTLHWFPNRFPLLEKQGKSVAQLSWKSPCNENISHNLRCPKWIM